MRFLFTLSVLVCAGSVTFAAPPGSIDEHGNRVGGADFPFEHGPWDGFDALLGREPCDADWRALGPFGGDADDVAMSSVDPSAVLAGIAPSGSSGGTLFRSTDGGATWVEVAALNDVSVFDIEFAPSGAVYIGTEDGVWKSTSHGASWTALDLGIGLNDTTYEVAIDPSDENTVYAGVADHLGSQDHNVMKSTDGGSSWFDVTPPMSPLGCHGVGINPTDSGNIVAVFGGSFGGGAVWVSDNGGATWTNRSSGLPGNPMNDAVHDGTRILVGGGMAYGSQTVGLYASSDNGASWSPLHDGSWTSLYVNDVEVDPTDGGSIYVAVRGGIFHSANGGETWDIGIGGTDPLMANSVRLDPDNPSGIFVGASSVAVWRSTDGGTTFAQSSVGIGQLNVYSAAANPNDIRELAIAFQGQNDGGVYTSVDGGTLWSLEGGLPPTRYNTVSFAQDGTLYAISEGPTTIAPEGLYRRNTDGTWTCLGPDQGALFETEARTVRFGLADPDLIMLGGNDFGVAGFEPTVWRSTDAGETWTKVYEGPTSSKEVEDIAIAPDGTDQTMVACYVNFGDPQIGGALRSVDGGVTWIESSAGLAAEPQCYALSTSPDDPDTFYLADGDSGTGNGGLYISTDAGQNWAAIGYTGHMVQDVIVDPLNGQTVYIMDWRDPKVMISHDGGVSFEPFVDGLGVVGYSRDLAYASGFYPQLLFATSTGTYATDLCKCPQPGCEADLDGDCRVDLADLATMLGNYGLPGDIADGDIAPPHDGIVDLADLALLLSQYGDDCN